MLILIIIECCCFVLVNQPPIASTFKIKHRFLELSNAYLKAQTIQCDTLFIGDSIGRQIFPPNNDERFITTHGGILSAGNYLLIEANIKNNKQLKTIIYTAAPFIISSDFGNKQTAMNFLKPFFIYRNFFKLSYINRYLLSKPHAYIYLTYLGKFLPFDDINLRKHKDRVKRSQLSDFSIHFFNKMIQLCETNNIELRLISPPISQSRKVSSGNFELMKKQVKKTALEPYFMPYLKNIFYRNDSFFTDGMHIQGKFIFKKRNRLSLRKKLLTSAKKSNN